MEGNFGFVGMKIGFRSELSVSIGFRRSAFENQNLLWSDMAGHTAALPEDFSRKPEVVYADKDCPCCTALNRSKEEQLENSDSDKYIDDLSICRFK